MNIFRRLRWKLTMSYTIVTVSVFLVVTLILGGIFFIRIFLPNNYLSPSGLVGVLMENTTPFWSHVLSNSQVDHEMVNFLLKSTKGTITSFDFLRIGDVQFSVSTVASFRVLIIGTDGTLLGTSDPSYLPTLEVGEPFDINRVPGLADPFTAALAGETDEESLYTIQGSMMTWYGPVNRFTLAIPIFNLVGEEENQVLGVLVAVIDSFPTQSEIPSHLLNLAGRSLLIFLLGSGILGAIFGAIYANGLISRFKRISNTTDHWSEGNFSTFIDDNKGDEITQFSQRLNNMAKQLQSLLRKRQDMAVSEERNRLARDLHDSAKQQALAASFELGTALTLYERDPQSARMHIEEADTLVDSVRKELTNLVHELRPQTMDGQDFNETFKEQAMDWSQRSGIELSIEIIGNNELSLEVRETMFRILQEALANITRHSSASRVEVILENGTNTIKMSIKDNGCGFDTSLKYAGVGLYSMQERAEALGGSFQVESVPEQGTKIEVALPNVNLEIG